MDELSLADRLSLIFISFALILYYINTKSYSLHHDDIILLCQC